ncbi:MAG: hypothetical protein COB35_03920 [Gammaproteobacteria bacterium]|nr:MAG: hypothetical protein COB35_03920 [Gammaproteobacteria bacterium]
MELHAHGSYHLNFENNILHIEAQGPFNETVLEKFHHDTHEIIKKHRAKKWASLVTYRGNGIFTPDAENALLKLMKHRARNGMIANASVLKESVHPDLQQTQLTRVYQAAKIHSHFFSEEKSAKNWLTQYLKERT